MSASYKPPGYSSVSPYLVVKNADEVIGFLVATLGGKPLRRYENDDGSILHAEIRIDDTIVMVGEAGGEWTAAPCHIHVYVPDVDGAFKRAVEFGAEAVQDPVQKDGDPDKRGGVRDPGGNTWWFSTKMD